MSPLDPAVQLEVHRAVESQLDRSMGPLLAPISALLDRIEAKLSSVEKAMRAGDLEQRELATVVQGLGKAVDELRERVKVLETKAAAQDAAQAGVSVRLALLMTVGTGLVMAILGALVSGLVAP